MKTPKEFNDNIKNNIITKEMLKLCLYSANKRAKNMRDKIREYKAEIRSNRYFYDKYNYIEKYQKQRDEYYNQKEILLQVLKPICIHKEILGYERIRYYDYEKEYNKYKNKAVWSNCFYNHEFQDFTYFIDVEDKDDPIIAYYLFYEIDEYSFHTPIDEEKALNQQEFEIIQIDKLDTKGHEIETLVSAQFVKKVVELIYSKNYIYKD